MSFILIINILLMLAIAICLDLKSGKISNTYNLCWMIYGVLYSLLFVAGGLLNSVLGIGIPFLGLMLLFKLGAIGAGDIKLFMAVGSFLGMQIIPVMIYSFLLCALYGVMRGATVALRRWRKGDGTNVLQHLVAGFRGNTRVAFSVFIGLGFVVYAIKTMGGGGWLEI
ncbi:MAG: prepilin peptidase [Lachnospiraceae bacterium]|nr:prepilin peptidase [Lachnospiraceae bacterium]